MSLSVLGQNIEIRARFRSIERLRHDFMVARNIADTGEFFSPDFDHLHDPYLLAGMDAAVERIWRAREAGERVVVFGDYDVDGVSSTALLVRFFHRLGWIISYRLPDRAKDGYGFKPHFLPDLAANDVKLVITVDCGTRDIATIEGAAELGIDVIVTDHHHVPERVPEGVVALLNPRLPGTDYPFPHLAGSGVAFKLLHACLLRMHPDDPDAVREELARYADLATLGTIADCMPLVGENRTIATLGLRQMARSEHPGLARLVEGRFQNPLDADVVGFQVGPRINAAGRLGSPYLALRALLAGEGALDDILSQLEQVNEDRKFETEKYLVEALQVVDGDRPAVFWDSEIVPHGIIGLIAGRLANRYDKPTICLKAHGPNMVASCRGPEWFDLVGALEEFREWFVAFGGHRQAAGFTIARDRYEAFREAFCKRVGELLPHPLPKKTLSTTAIPLEALDGELADCIDAFRPFGRGNEKPLFLIEDFIPAEISYLGNSLKHLKMRHFALPAGAEIVAFGFGDSYHALRSGVRFDLVVEVERTSFRGQSRLQIMVRDIVMRPGLQ
jgi:single-stranded-DNA-specific exonuclease